MGASTMVVVLGDGKRLDSGYTSEAELTGLSWTEYKG